MATGGRSSKLVHRGIPAARSAGGAASPMQLPLLFYQAPVIDSKRTANGSDVLPDSSAVKLAARLPALDRLTTREVLKVVAVHRSTLHRWVTIGRFPRRHKSGGWLRSDVEKWLTEHEGEHC